MISGENLRHIEVIENILLAWTPCILAGAEEINNDKPKFDVLADLMCTLVALPHSSACVERIFSQVNIVKTKQCNKLLCETVSNRILARQAVKKGGNMESVYHAVWCKTCGKDIARKRYEHFALHVAQKTPNVNETEVGDFDDFD